MMAEKSAAFFEHINVIDMMCEHVTDNTSTLWLS